MRSSTCLQMNVFLTRMDKMMGSMNMPRRPGTIHYAGVKVAHGCAAATAYLGDGSSEEVFEGARGSLWGSGGYANCCNRILQSDDQRSDLRSRMNKTKIVFQLVRTFTALSSDAAEAVLSASPSAAVSTSPREARADAASCSWSTMAWMWGRASSAVAYLQQPRHRRH